MIDYMIILFLSIPLVMLLLVVMFGRRIPFVATIIIMIIFFVLMFFVIQSQILNMMELEVIETIPSEDIPYILKANESKTVTVTMIDVLENKTETVNQLVLYIPTIDTYSWFINQYQKEPTTNETYQNLFVTIYSQNQTNITNLSNFTTQPYYINSANVPWLFPIVDNVTYNVTYTFVAPANISNGTIFVMPPVETNPITTVFKDVEPKKETDYWVWIIPILAWLPTLIMIIVLLNKKQKQRVSDLEDMIRKLDKMNKRMEAFAEDKTEKKIEKKTEKTKYGEIPKQQSDYTLAKMITPDEAIILAKDFRDKGYWVKIVNFSKESKNIEKENCCGVYISDWKKEDYETKGKPKWK